MPLSIYRLNTKIRPTMLCLSGFELYSRWVPQFPFLFLTHSLFFSDIPGSQPLFHSDFFIQHARKSTFPISRLFFHVTLTIYPSCNLPPLQPPEAPHTQKARLQSQAKMADVGAHATEFYLNSP